MDVRECIKMLEGKNTKKKGYKKSFGLELFDKIMTR